MEEGTQNTKPCLSNTGSLITQQQKRRLKQGHWWSVEIKGGLMEQTGMIKNLMQCIFIMYSNII